MRSFQPHSSTALKNTLFSPPQYSQSGNLMCCTTSRTGYTSSPVSLEHQGESYVLRRQYICYYYCWICFYLLVKYYRLTVSWHNTFYSQQRSKVHRRRSIHWLPKWYPSSSGVSGYPPAGTREPGSFPSKEKASQWSGTKSSGGGGGFTIMEAKCKLTNRPLCVSLTPVWSNY